jgi:hypothetical protein
VDNFHSRKPHAIRCVEPRSVAFAASMAGRTSTGVCRFRALQAPSRSMQWNPDRIVRLFEATQAPPFSPVSARRNCLIAMSTSVIQVPAATPRLIATRILQDAHEERRAVITALMVIPSCLTSPEESDWLDRPECGSYSAIFVEKASASRR